MKITLQFEATKEELEVLSQNILSEIQDLAETERLYKDHLKDSFFQLYKMYRELNKQIAKQIEKARKNIMRGVTNA